MPRIFDNIDEYLSSALQNSLSRAHRADFFVGYNGMIEVFYGVEKPAVAHFKIVPESKKSG